MDVNALHRRDRGVVLTLTLILVVVLALVVVAIADFAVTGLRTSEVSTRRTESNMDASAAITWVIEEFSAKRLVPSVDCTAPDTSIAVPPGVAPGATVAVTCNPSDEADNYPAVDLVAVASSPEATRRIEVLLQVPRTDFNAQVRTWDVD